MKRTPFSGLWRHPAFRLFWAGQTISVFGDQVSALAVPLVAVFTLQASAVQMGLLNAAGRAPLFLFGLFAGVWVDRVRRRPLLIGADLGRSLLLGSIPLVAWLGWLDMPYLYGVAVLVGTLAVCFNTAYQAFLPALVAREQLVEGNSKLTMTRSVAGIAGPGLAGAIVQGLTAPVAILVDAGSFLGSALCLGLLRHAEPAPLPRASRRNVWHEIGEGLRLVARQPLLRASAGSASTYNFFNTALITVYVLYLSRDLRIPPAALGVILASVGPGSLVGAALATQAAKRWGLGPTLVGGLALAGGANLIPPLALGPPAVLIPTLAVAAFLTGFGQPFYNINQVSLRQAIVPQHLQGRIGATLQFLGGAAAPLGALLGGFLGQALGVRLTLVIGAVGMLLACLWPLCSPVRTLREAPEPGEVVLRPTPMSNVK